jgi:TRAP-type C4-dicarboxylate transport system permease small subunit
MSGDVFQTGARDRVKPDVLLRTRRSVMDAAYRMHEKRARQRQHVGIALLVVSVLLVLFAPAVWFAASNVTAGEPVLGIPVVLVTLSVVLLSAVLAVAMMTWKRVRTGVRGQ